MSDRLSLRTFLMEATMPPEEIERYHRREKLTARQDHEHMTSQENAFIRHMSQKKQTMETLVIDLIYPKKHDGPFRKRRVLELDFKPAFDFLQELQNHLRGPHECTGESSSCWFQKLSDIYDEYLEFLKIYSLVIVVSDQVQDSYLLFEPTEEQ